jgi:pimeloyl-ACP methyl ester carboxylesterase
MRNLFTIALAGALAAVVDATNPIIMAPITTKGEDIAIIWIHGMDCENSAYTSIASTVQAKAASSGQKVWIGLPQFLFDKPEPILMDHYVSDTIKALRADGFTGDNILIAGHSLGGVMAQNYSGSNSDTIKGQFLMGSVLTRDKRKI